MKPQSILKRYCQVLNLKEDPKLIALYERAHSREEIWPEILQGIRSVGITSMEIYREGTTLVMIVEAPEDFSWTHAMAKLSTLPRQEEWEKHVAKYQDCSSEATSDQKWRMASRIFYLYENEEA